VPSAPIILPLGVRDVAREHRRCDKIGKHKLIDFHLERRAAIVGAACRLPGASDRAEFRKLLVEKRCSVREYPDGRWNIARHLHPSRTAVGFAYSYAGGYLDEPYAFDPGVFGLSPREAIQMDPQQRILLEVVREALEDAEIAPTSLAGAEVGVYVGGSSLDHGNIQATDPASIDTHFMTGNTLSILANRISHVFDLRGPSLTIDTACSSSLVAFARAAADIESGAVDTAIVAGVNMLLFPTSFIGFSRASMLSPTGLCRPFSADGDGYVRGEGAVAFVLTRDDIVRQGALRAVIEASGVNSDGHTSGIALPGLDGQIALLERVWRRAGISPDDLAFVEAHGTGTRVGDPIEAKALGEVLGRRRSAPLPIGSVKSNIGHLEPASGVAGLMKALIALETRALPASLHLDEINPDIDFAGLNLAPAREPVALSEGTEGLVAGVSSYGFGGTNAHVVLRGAPVRHERPREAGADRLVVSAACREALRAAAGALAERIERGADPRRVAAAIDAGRDLMKHRAVVATGGADVGEALRRFAEDGRHDAVEEGVAPAREAKICFVYSGNGAQYAGMGRTAFARDPAFRARFEEIDRAVARLTDRSLVADLHDPAFADRMGQAAFLQPLLFAVQASITAGLAAAGLRPSVVLGHSLGELAAAEAAGALDLDDAVRVVLARASCQEVLHGRGTMAVFAASIDVVADLIADLGRDDVEIAAENGPASVTITGPVDAVALATRTGRRRRLASRTLDLAYPFHSRLIEGRRADLLEKIGVIAPRPATVEFVSTVTGERMGTALADAEHWWRNLRAPVLFRAAIERAAALGSDLFVEIGPRPVLVSPITDTLRGTVANARVVASLAEADDRRADVDPIGRAAARIVANGGGGRRSEAVPAVDRTLDLPTYAWQRRELRYTPTSERVDLFADGATHPLIGTRLAEGLHEWRHLLDARLVPHLADHVVDGEIVVPAAAMAEMVLAVGRAVRPEGALAFEDLDVLMPLVLPRDGLRELVIRHSVATGGVEIWSRPRLGPDEWSLHARARLIAPFVSSDERPATGPTRPRLDAAAIYAAAATFGIDYGPAYRLAVGAVGTDDSIDVEMVPPSSPGTGPGYAAQSIHPASLDAALHPLFCLIDADPSVRQSHLPVRYARMVLRRDGATVVAARLHLVRATPLSRTVDVRFFGDDGSTVAEIEGLQIRTVVLERRSVEDACFHVEMRRRDRDGPFDAPAVAATALADAGAPSADDDGRLMLRAHMLASAHRALARIADADGRIDLAAAVAEGQIAPVAASYAAFLVDRLVSAGLADGTGDEVRLLRDSGLPKPEPILASFAAEFSGRSDELLLSTRAADELDAFLRDGVASTSAAAAAQRFDALPLVSAPTLMAFDRAIDALARASGDLPLRVVLARPHAQPLLSRLLARIGQGSLQVSVAGDDRGALERLKARLPAGSGVTVLDPSSPPSRRPRHDLAVFVAPRERSDDALFERIAGEVVDGGAFLTLQGADDGLVDFWFGSAPDWFAASLDPLSPIGPLRSVAETRRDLTRIGMEDVTEFDVGPAGETALLGRLPRRHHDEAEPSVVVTTSSGAGDDFATRVEGLVVARGGRVVEDPGASGSTALTRIRVLSRNRGDDRRRTAAAIAEIRANLLATADVRPRPRLHVVVWSGTGATADPVADAVRAFVRVAANEHPDAGLRLLEIDEGLDEARAAAAIVDWSWTDDGERETRIAPNGVFVPRVRRGLPPSAGAAECPEALEGVLPRRGAPQHFTWAAKSRRAPGDGEIEVEVAATGLNFRDVMLAMGLLDEGDLADGMAGAVFGFECVGRVVAVGAGVEGRAIGDAVLGFASGAFATHVTAPASVFVPVPAGLDLAAAATVPVAFLTAWYGLVECARVKAGDVVLVHGAAGGVGLAALQVARGLGARVVATVSTPEKRALVRLFGAEAVYDSRSLDFADAIRRDFGGADVVLNSLAGDAMRAGVKCLKPFGRFVELGKRDYVANTELGLRPFRRNLTYYGVDVDQLLVHDPSIVARGFETILRGFEEGRFTPLPHRLFAAEEIGEAFRLMQAAGHVGKILVRPPARDGRFAPPPARLPAAGSGVQLVVGGTGGFGLATARHLAERGATRIVVASRGGRLEEGAEAEIAALRARGVDFRVERVDVTDLASVEGLLARIEAGPGPVRGIHLTAMVLDDGLIADLDAERIDRVLAPKIAGADNLDRATRGRPIDDFVLYSSAAALVGNPGQGAYAAANGYLEGLARRRRAEGLPALAVAWGAITDVGVLARDGATAARLERITGVSGFRAAEALALLDEVAGRSTGFTDPVVCCARFRRTGAMRDLVVLDSPAFEGFLGDEVEARESDGDLASRIEGKSETEALEILGDLVVGEIARILRLSASEIDRSRPLGELGLDSLMALELRMNVETRFGVELPLVAITSVKNLHELSRRLLQSLRADGTGATDGLGGADEALVTMHGGDGAAFAGLADKIEEQRRMREERT